MVIIKKRKLKLQGIPSYIPILTKMRSCINKDVEHGNSLYYWDYWVVSTETYKLIQLFGKI